jgi:hypothetical protein
MVAGGTVSGGLEPRWFAAFGCLVLFLGVFGACLWAGRRCQRPAVLWGVGVYFMALLAVFVYGFASGTRFETAFGQLAMLTFPFSILSDHTITQPGFGSAREIARNFLRYFLVYGGLDGAILSAFLWTMTGRRSDSAR